MNPIRVKQQGIGLIELMIALVISLFLMIGLGTVFYGMRQNSMARSGLSELQDQQRTAMTLLAGAVQQAGYFPDPLTETNTTVFAKTEMAPAFALGAFVTGTDTSLSIRYKPDPAAPMGTCAGMSKPAPAVAAIYVDTYSVSAAGTLDCTETIDGAANPNGTQSLVNGISDLAVKFGVDINGDGSEYQYLPAGDLSEIQWGYVKSIRVTLNFKNPMSGQAGQPATIPFTRTIGLMNSL